MATKMSSSRSHQWYSLGTLSLIRYHIDKSTKDFHEAIRMRDLMRAVELLQDGGVRFNVIVDGFDAFSLAITFCFPAMIDLILSLILTHCDVRLAMAYSQWGSRCQGWCAFLYQSGPEIDMCQAIEVERCLFHHGSTIDVEWKFFEHPLYATTRYFRYYGKDLVTKRLLKNGITVNVRDERGRTPLYYALLNGRLDLARLLLECGANIGSVRWSRMKNKLHKSIKSNEEDYAWLEKQLTAPASLQVLCRQTIRHQLVKVHRKSLIINVWKLPLPDLIIEYISLEELLK